MLAATGLVAAPAAVAQSVSPQQAPPAWIAYAEIVNREVSARLGGDGAEALRLRTYLQSLPGGGAEGSSPPIALKLWIDAGGKIERAEFPPFPQPQPNDDLRGLLVGQTLSATPPKGMLPLRLSIRVEPKPQDAATPAP